MCFFKVENKRIGRKRTLVTHKMSCWKQKVFFSFNKLTWILICTPHLQHGHRLLPCAKPKAKEGFGVNSWTPRTQGLGMATLWAPSQCSIRPLMFSQSLDCSIRTGALLVLNIPASLSSLWEAKAQPWFQMQGMKAPCELEPCSSKPSNSIFGW